MTRKYQFLFSLAFLATMLSANNGQVSGRKILYPDSKILFIGLWDRAYPLMEQISKETGIHLDQYCIQDVTTPENLEKHYSQIQFDKYELILILQIYEVECNILNEKLTQAKKKNPNLDVIEVDYRASHEQMLGSGVLKPDKELNRYWKNFSPENLKRLLVYGNVKYAGGKGEIQPPVEVPSHGIYHPDAKDFFPDWDSYIAWYKTQKNYTEGAPFVAMSMDIDYVIYNDGRVYQAMIREVEKNKLNIIPMFGEAKALQSIVRAGKPSLLLLQHHSGPEEMPKEGEQSFLEEMGIPYLFCGGLLGKVTVEEWENDVKSGSWSDYSGISRHEFFGIIEPHIIGAKSISETGYVYNKPIEERVEKFVQRIKGWLRLQQLDNKDKKVAIVYFHKYLGKADIGRPGEEMNRYINVPKSIYNTLQMLDSTGYSINPMPSTELEVETLMREKGRNIPDWLNGEKEDFVESADPVLIPVEKYKEWFNSKMSEKARQQVIDVHGEIPGKLSIYEKDGKQYIMLPVVKLGNVILAPQPDIGIKQFKSVMQSRKVPPSHNFLAFYFWLQEEFKADALVHYGAFGDDVFLPGKEIFLSKDDFPDIIIGNMPHIYIWPIENVGIGIIAKRRTYAVLIDHFVGPPLPAEFSLELSNLESGINQFTQIKSENPLKEEYRKTVTEEAAKLRLPEKIGITLGKDSLLSDENIADLQQFVAYAKTQNSPTSMHVFGEETSDDKAIPFLAFMLQQNSQFIEKMQGLGIVGKDLMDAAKSEKVIKLLEYLLLSKYSDKEISKTLGVDIAKVKSALKDQLPIAQKWWKNLKTCGATEEKNLLAVLNGRYVSPGPGATPLTNPDVLPTGRNMYGINLKQIPSKEAWKVATGLLDQTLNDYKKKHGEFPKRVAFTLTGMETFTNMGVPEAQVFYLMGIRPKWNDGGMINGLEVIPRSELKRPRIDPFINVNGIFLKNFPYLINLLDEAVNMTIKIDEPDNYVRITRDDISKGLLAKGSSKEQADTLSRVRIFGTKAGEGGGRLFMLLPRSGTWDNRDDILNVWNTMRTHTYSRDIWGEKNQELYNLAIQERELVIATWGNNLYGPLTNHHYPEETGGLAMAIQMIGGKAPDVAIQDIRNKKLSVATSLKEVLNAELLATAMNETWIKGQMKEGYIGGTQFLQIPDNLFQWESVNQGLVSEAVWDQLAEIYVDDKFNLKMQEWFDENNPYAFQQLLAPMLEAVRKNYWHPSDERVQQLVEAYANSVAKFGYNGGLYEGGNTGFHQTIAAGLNKANKTELLQAYQQKVNAGMVKGQKMEQQGDTQKHFNIPYGYLIAFLALAALFGFGFWRRSGAASGGSDSKNKNS